MNFVDEKIIHKNLNMNNLININDSNDTTNALIMNFKQAQNNNSNKKPC